MRLGTHGQAIPQPNCPLCAGLAGISGRSGSSGMRRREFEGAVVGARNEQPGRNFFIESILNSTGQRTGLMFLAGTSQFP